MGTYLRFIIITMIYSKNACKRVLEIFTINHDNFVSKYYTYLYIPELKRLMVNLDVQLPRGAENYQLAINFE